MKTRATLSVRSLVLLEDELLIRLAIAVPQNKLSLGTLPLDVKTLIRVGDVMKSVTVPMPVLRITIITVPCHDGVTVALVAKQIVHTFFSY